MKIRTKIVLTNVFHIALLALVGGFAMQNLNVMLTKLRFVEIADDLNASFLEMRIDEKNYVLYRDETALFEIDDKITQTLNAIDTVKEDISRAIGGENLQTLQSYVASYAEIVQQVRTGKRRNANRELKLRMAGKKLREFAGTMTNLERRGVNDIISRSKKALFYSFLTILVSAMAVSHILWKQILRALGKIEGLAKAVSAGDFHGTDDPAPADEFGTVITAVNAMTEELRDREEELIQSKKLASLGVLTAGVAHELTNPLNNISMIAQNFVDLYDYLGAQNHKDLMNKVQGETERIEAVVRNLLDFSKPREAHLKDTDINNTVRRSVRLMQNTLDISNVETRLVLQDDVPHVFIDDNQIVQVLVNLIVNAVHAMKPGGILSLSTKALPSADGAQIVLADTGKGIPSEYLPHIFDPFFTTKGVEGTGLGLSVTYSIIASHKGTVKVDSAVNAGTTFTIELPIHKGENE